ncbi:MAG: SCP2 sterol-binding domain-containing protein [Spirochaetota bacterium]|nr:SCP2 sterol-binding domain-containing protein [Spirochaetota bacterium]
MGFHFLSNDWFQEVKRLREDAGDLGVPEDLMKLTINIRVTGGPDGEKKLHLKGGTIYQGKADLAATNITITYDLARKVLLENDLSAVMKGMATRKVKVKGDLTKMMALQNITSNESVQSLMGKVLEMTD